jgi:mono/diheme cytochrome c family protein
MKNYWYIFIGIAAFVLFAGVSADKENRFLVDENTSVSEVLRKLGDKPSPHQPNFSINGVSAEAGEDLVLRGIAKDPKGGGETKKQSKHFVCTSCHNVEREDPDLSKVDPEARLLFVKEKGLPFLQGTALYGAVNRTNFYNGDYEKKYGNLVEPARNNIREAIQLCAVECSQGRRLESWEMESVLAYMWTIDLKMGDLLWSENEMETIKMKAEQGIADTTAVSLIKSKYLAGAPATFVDPPQDRKQGYTRTGDPDNGKLIYELSCLHCHKNERYSFLNLDESKYSLKFLENYFPKYSDLSVYYVARYGTKPHPGKRSYMPHYTKEKLSNEMMEDLRTYVEQAGKY